MASRTVSTKLPNMDGTKVYRIDLLADSSVSIRYYRILVTFGRCQHQRWPPLSKVQQNSQTETSKPKGVFCKTMSLAVSP